MRATDGTLRIGVTSATATCARLADSQLCWRSIVLALALAAVSVRAPRRAVRSSRRCRRCNLSPRPRRRCSRGLLPFASSCRDRRVVWLPAVVLLLFAVGVFVSRAARWSIGWCGCRMVAICSRRTTAIAVAPARRSSPASRNRHRNVGAGAAATHARPHGGRRRERSAARCWPNSRRANGSATLYVAFCPPFERLPQVEVEVADDSDANVKFAQVLHNGAQLEVRLAQPATEVDQQSPSNSSPPTPNRHRRLPRRSRLRFSSPPLALSRFSPAGYNPRKLTSLHTPPGDTTTSNLRIGIGEDTHRTAPGGPLRLGGIDVPHDRQLVGHSDADVLLHAVTDALLGAAALPDIGRMFPNTDAANRGRDSAEMLRRRRRQGRRGRLPHREPRLRGPRRAAEAGRLPRRHPPPHRRHPAPEPAPNRPQSQDGRRRGPGRPRGSDRGPVRGAVGSDRRARSIAADSLASMSIPQSRNPQSEIELTMSVSTRPMPAKDKSAAAHPTLRVYNTLSQAQGAVRARCRPGKVGIYLCGPTVYDKAHIGHMVGPVIFDCIKRYLTYCGYDVTWVVNITDVDDKLIKKANERGISMLEVAEENIADYNGNLAALGVDQIDHFPRATECMPRDHRSSSKRSIDRGFAYESDGDVYFDVGKDAEYGKLSNRIDRVDAGRRRRDGGPQAARRPTSPCGKRPSRASRRGTAPGARAGRAGTSSARP